MAVAILGDSEIQPKQDSVSCVIVNWGTQCNQGIYTTLNFWVQKQHCKFTQPEAKFTDWVSWSVCTIREIFPLQVARQLFAWFMGGWGEAAVEGNMLLLLYKLAQRVAVLILGMDWDIITESSKKKILPSSWKHFTSGLMGCALAS